MDNIRLGSSGKVNKVKKRRFNHEIKRRSKYQRMGSRWQRSDFKSSFDSIREVHFLRFEFQKFGESDFGNILYMLYRVIYACVVLTIFYRSANCPYQNDELSKHFLYFSQWSLLLQTLYAFLFCLLVLGSTVHHCFHRNDEEPEEILNPEFAMVLESRLLGKFEKLVWFIHNISIGISMIVTLDYWIAQIMHAFGPISKCDEVIQFFAISCPGILSLIDLCVCAIPIRLGHAFYTTLFTATYFTFAAIYEGTDGSYYCPGEKDRSCEYIYEFFDWRTRPGHAALAYLWYSLASGAFHIVLFLIYKLRLLILSSTCKQDAFLDHQYPFSIVNARVETARGYFGMTDPDNPFPKRIMINDGLPITRAAALKEVKKLQMLQEQMEQTQLTTSTPTPKSKSSSKIREGGSEKSKSEVITPFPPTFSGDPRTF